METQQRQWIQIHDSCAVIASHLAKNEAAADVVVVADAVTAGAWEGELVCDAEFACEGECVLWRLGDASAGASLEASATMGEIWGETERGRGLKHLRHLRWEKGSTNRRKICVFHVTFVTRLSWQTHTLQDTTVHPCPCPLHLQMREPWYVSLSSSLLLCHFWLISIITSNLFSFIPPSLCSALVSYSHIPLLLDHPSRPLSFIGWKRWRRVSELVKKWKWLCPFFFPQIKFMVLMYKTALCSSLPFPFYYSGAGDGAELKRKDE